MENHGRQVVPDSTRSLPCSNCNRTFRSPHDLNKHKQTTTKHSFQQPSPNQNRAPGKYKGNTQSSRNQNRGQGIHKGNIQPSRPAVNTRKAHVIRGPPSSTDDMAKRVHEDDRKGHEPSKKTRQNQAVSVSVRSTAVVSSGVGSSSTMGSLPHNSETQPFASYSPQVESTANTYSTHWKQTSNTTAPKSYQHVPPHPTSAFTNPCTMYPDFLKGLTVDLVPVYYLPASMEDLPSTVRPGRDIAWKQLDPADHEKALESLSTNRHSHSLLSNSRYRVGLPDESELSLLRRCKNCGGKAKVHNTAVRQQCVFHPQSGFTLNERNEKLFACCGKPGGCKTLPKHDYLEVDDQIRENYEGYIKTPSQSAPYKRRAVVLDCEMVGVAGSQRSEPVRISAVDYLTGETLVDTFIRVNKPITDWRTKHSGVNAEIMNEAYVQGNMLPDWQTARLVLYNFIDAETIIVGQALSNDLEMLRMVHTNIVDSCILPKVVTPGITRTWSLKNFCSELFNIQVQNRGKKGHDPWEDCMATREIVLWMTGKPEEFKKWGAAKLKEEKKKRKEQRLKALEEQAKKVAEMAKKREAEQDYGSSTETSMARRREMLIDLGFSAEELGAGVVY